MEVAIDPAGNIVIGGRQVYSSGSVQYKIGLARFTPAGVLDSTFGKSGEVLLLAPGSSRSALNGLGFQSNGDIIIGGFAFYSTISRDYLLVGRLTPNGALDPTFGSGGLYTTSQMGYAQGIVVQPDDKIVAMGVGWQNGTYDYNYWVTRVLADGSAADPSFGTNSLGEANFGFQTAPFGIALDPNNGDIVVTGNSYIPNTFVQFETARFLGDPPPASPPATNTTPMPPLAPIAPVTIILDTRPPGQSKPTGA